MLTLSTLDGVLIQRFEVPFDRPDTLHEAIKNQYGSRNPLLAGLRPWMAQIEVEHEPASGSRRGKRIRVSLCAPNKCSLRGKTAAERAIPHRHVRAWGLLREPADEKAVGALADVLPPGTMQAHFGALRGINAFEERDSGFSIGREQPSVAQIEEMTRPFTATDREPFFSILANDEFGGQGVCQMRGVRMRDGTVEPIEVEVHPDPRCQAMLEQIREAEVVQGIDRVRPIFNRRLLYLLNALACDITVDRLATWRELRSGGSRFEQAFARTGRTVVLLTYGELSRCFNDLFPTSASVAERRRRAGNNPHGVPIEYLLEKRGGFFYTYRRPGQRGQASRAVVAGDVPDPLAALEAVVGAVAVFTRDDAESADWADADADGESAAEEARASDPTQSSRDDSLTEATDVGSAPPVDVAGTSMSGIIIDPSLLPGCDPSEFGFRADPGSSLRDPPPPGYSIRMAARYAAAGWKADLLLPSPPGEPGSRRRLLWTARSCGRIPRPRRLRAILKPG